MNKIKYLTFNRALRIGIFKTILINFSCFSFPVAIKLPIIVSRYTRLKKIGKILLEGKPSIGMITIGFAGDDFTLSKNMWNVINNRGVVIFRGKANVGIGSTIFVGKQGKLTFGENFTCNFNSKIICYEKITIGKTVRLAWDVQIFDTNFHYVENINTSSISPKNQEIRIGDFCWINNRTSIMKGTVINSYTIVASNSICNKNYEKIPQYSIIGGIPAKLLKSGYKRVFDIEEEIKLNKQFGFIK
jgi:acetyltransferase-like isoleucine patch superfamily enzyme